MVLTSLTFLLLGKQRRRNPSPVQLLARQGNGIFMLACWAYSAHRLRLFLIRMIPLRYEEVIINVNSAIVRLTVDMYAHRHGIIYCKINGAAGIQES